MGGRAGGSGSGSGYISEMTVEVVSPSSSALGVAPTAYRVVLRVTFVFNLWGLRMWVGNGAEGWIELGMGLY